ncbi:MAG: hypothetical protein ACE5KM_00400, partial [Planctomycetaceae bacterium]
MFRILIATSVIATAAVADDAQRSRSADPSVQRLRKGYLLAPKAFRSVANGIRPAVVAIETFGGVLPGTTGKRKRRGAGRPGDGPTTG